MANIIAINPFEVAPGTEAEALRIWDRVAEFMQRQPGFISARLHQSLDPQAKFQLVTVAEWQSAQHFMTMLASDELKDAARGLEAFPHYPGLYRVIRT